MAYNSLISRTDAAALIPEEASREILQATPAQSMCMSLGRRLPNLARAQKRMPVMSALALAYPVNGDTGLKQTTEVNWENKYIDAEEVACIVPIPEAVLDDADYDIWGEIRPSIAEAFGKLIDEMVLFGSSIFSNWSTNLGGDGLTAVANTASQRISLASYSDFYEAVLGETSAGTAGAVMLIEADGFMPTGYASAVSVRGKLRNLRDSQGGLLYKSNIQGSTSYMFDGEPLYFAQNGCWGVAENDELLFAGDWSKLVWAMRQDLTYKILDQAVITDAAGNIVYNLAQQDMVALRAVMRLGFALPNPINRMQATEASRCAFSVLTA